MCMDCIKMTTDITEGIPREGVVHYCRGCEVVSPLFFLVANFSDICNLPMLGSQLNLKVENYWHYV